LALTCWRCNRHKGTDLGSYDPETGEFSFLFNPRKQKWSEHFVSEEADIDGLTPEGRTTVKLLQLNGDERLSERKRFRDRYFELNNLSYSAWVPIQNQTRSLSCSTAIAC